MAFAIPSKNRLRDGERREEDIGSKRAGNGAEGRGGDAQTRLERDDRDIALCFLSGQMIYRVSPCISPRATAPQKHVRSRESHQKRRLRGCRRAERAAATRENRGRKERGRERGRLASRAIWVVLHIYGLLVPARKQISGKSRSEITLEPLGRKAAPFSSERIYPSCVCRAEYYFPGKWHAASFLASRFLSIRARFGFCESSLLRVKREISFRAVAIEAIRAI